MTDECNRRFHIDIHLIHLSKTTVIGSPLLLVFFVPTTLNFPIYPMDADLIRNLTVVEALVLEVTRSTDGGIRTFELCDKSEIHFKWEADLFRLIHNVTAII